MHPKITKQSVPEKSLLYPKSIDAYFYDSYEIPNSQQFNNAMDFYLGMVSKTPQWVNKLMRLRNQIVGFFGLKNLGQMGDVDKSKRGNQYSVGDKVGIFSVNAISNTEVILGDSDNHLDVEISIHLNEENQQMVSVTTVVNIHNWLGRIYMFVVTPLHKIIVPASLSRMLP